MTKLENITQEELTELESQVTFVDEVDFMQAIENGNEILIAQLHAAYLTGRKEPRNSLAQVLDEMVVEFFDNLYVEEDE